MDGPPQKVCSGFQMHSCCGRHYFFSFHIGNNVGLEFNFVNSLQMVDEIGIYIDILFPFVTYLVCMLAKLLT